MEGVAVMSQEIDVEAVGAGEYRVTVASHDGPVELTVVLDDLGTTSAGQLEDDAATARAIVAFLLTRQDAVDLPGIIEFGDVVAAYPDAVDEVVSAREG